MNHNRDTDRRHLPDGTSLLERMRRGEATAETVVREHLVRLRDRQVQLGGAVAIRESEAMAQAAAPARGPLSGLPVSVKETIGLAGERITAGSARMPPVECHEDSSVVQRLQAAGAVIVARSNVPELAITPETDNIPFGRTNNPLNVQRTCGGSSGGEGAIVAAGGSAIGIGSDILGSIRIPASFCGVVGFKPASSSIARDGTWPEPTGYLGSWLAIGPLARSVRDCRLAYNVLATRKLPAPASVSGMRLVIPQQFPFRVSEPCISDALVRAELILRDAGMEMRREHFGDVRRHFLDIPTMMAAELHGPMRECLRNSDGKALSLLAESVRQLIGRPRIYPGLFRTLALIQPFRLRTGNAAIAATRRYEQGRALARRILSDDGIALLPATTMLAPRHGAMNRLAMRPGFNPLMTPTVFPNAMDLPAITVPAWRHRDDATGLVPGIMLVAAPGNEGGLLDAAAVLEAGIARREDRQ